MLWLRKFVFYIFALVYLILCPFIITRMLGFVINPLTHRLNQTGLVYVSTIPPDATVYIDGRMSHQKTPTVIRDLTPGEHFIRIEHERYNDWERKIPIVGKKATVLANTLLIPEEWPIQKISKQSYQNIAVAADDVLIATNPILKDIDIFHADQGMGTSLLTGNSPYAAWYLVRLIYAPQSPFILLEINIKDKYKFLWVSLKENPPLVEEISKDKAVRNAAGLPKILSQQPSGNPQDKFFINDKNDLLTRKGMWIRLYPKENFGNPRAYDIAKSKPSTNMFFEEKNGKLFYLDNAGFLCAAQILPNHPILNIPIPDKMRIKTNARFYGKDEQL